MDTIIDFSEAMKLVEEATVANHAVEGFAKGSLMDPSLPAHVYHADRTALSCSLLKPLLVSPAHFQAALVKRGSFSPAKDFGSLLHVLLLQPHLVGQEIAVYPGMAVERDREFKKFSIANANKIVVDEGTFSKALVLGEKIQNTPYKGRPIGRFLEESQTEVSMYFNDPTTGLRLRVRPDIYHPDISFDLKSTRQANKTAFARDAIDMGYDLQSFIYTLARALFEGSAKSKPFVFIAAETNDPNSVFALEAGESFMTNGARKYQECITVYQACSAANYWPDLSCSDTLEIDHWQQFTPSSAWRDALKA